MTTSTDSRSGQYVNTCFSEAYDYAELAVSSLTVAVTTVSNHYTYTWTDSHAELT